jgi:hypothetical protein
LSATSDWEETSSRGGAKSEDFEELKLEAESMDDEWPLGGTGMDGVLRAYSTSPGS